MALINHVVAGTGTPPIVFVHGFSCDHTDWRLQVAEFSKQHKTVAVDLTGHGASKASGAECSIEALAAGVAAVMRSLDLGPSIVVGHSMGCRVATEVAMQVPHLTAGLILVDGSQFSKTTEDLVRKVIAAGELDKMLAGMFGAMFNEKSAPEVRQAIVERALRLPKDVAIQMTLDSVRYDTTRFEHALSTIRAPIQVIQTTYTNERRERMPLEMGQSVPYLDMLKRIVPNIEIEIIPGYGHFPQIDAGPETNGLIGRFVSRLAVHH